MIAQVVQLLVQCECRGGKVGRRLRALRHQARERWHHAQLQLNATLGEQRVAALHALIQESLTLLAEPGEENPHG